MRTFEPSEADYCVRQRKGVQSEIMHHGNAGKNVSYGIGAAGAVAEKVGVTRAKSFLIACVTLPKCDALVRVWPACRP